MDALSVSSGSDEGLAGLVAHAAREAAGEERAPIGLLELELERHGEAKLPRVAVEAAFAQQEGRRVIERLGVRLRARASSAPDPALIGEALSEFGGRAFTNVVLSHPAEPRDLTEQTPYRVADAGAPGGEVEAIDITVSFPSRLPWFAKNDALLSETLGAADLAACSELLGELGVRYGRRANRLEIARRQLRAPLDVEQQLGALLAAARRRLHVALFAASLPPRLTARVEIAPSPTPGGDAHELDVCLIRGLYTFGGGQRTSTSIDAVALQDFFHKHFEFEFANKSWRVLNVHGDRPQLRFGVIHRQR